MHTHLIDNPHHLQADFTNALIQAIHVRRVWANKAGPVLRIWVGLFPVRLRKLDGACVKFVQS